MTDVDCMLLFNLTEQFKDLVLDEILSTMMETNLQNISSSSSSSSEHGQERKPSELLQQKIDLVQQILTQLESILAAVQTQERDIARSCKQRMAALEIEGANIEIRMRRNQMVASNCLEIIGKGINKYCAFENILRTVEESRTEDEVRILLPDISGMDKMVEIFQADKWPEWMRLKREVHRLNRESEAPLLSKILQVRFSDSNQDIQQQQRRFSEGRGQKEKRPISPCGHEIEHPTKYVRISCHKKDAEAATIIQRNAKDIVKDMYRNKSGIIEVVDITDLEETASVLNCSDLAPPRPEKKSSIIEVVDISDVEETVSVLNCSDHAPPLTQKNTSCDQGFQNGGDKIHCSIINTSSNVNLTKSLPSKGKDVQHPLPNSCIQNQKAPLELLQSLCSDLDGGNGDVATQQIYGGKTQPSHGEEDFRFQQQNYIGDNQDIATDGSDLLLQLLEQSCNTFHEENSIDTGFVDVGYHAPTNPNTGTVFIPSPALQGKIIPEIMNLSQSINENHSFDHPTVIQGILKPGDLTVMNSSTDEITNPSNQNSAAFDIFVGLQELLASADDDDPSNTEVESEIAALNEPLQPVLNKPGEDNIPLPLEPPINREDFGELDLDEELIIALRNRGIKTPKEIQKKGIPALGSGQDVVVRGNTGGGKTTLIAVSVLQMIKTEDLSTQVIILTPSKRQAANVQKLICDISKSMKVMCSCADNLIKNELKKPGSNKGKEHLGHILTGTPQATFNFIQRQKFRNDTVRTLVLDSSDDMLEYGSQPIIRKILYALNADTQVVMTTTRNSPAVINFSRQLRNPLEISEPEIDFSEIDNNSTRDRHKHFSKDKKDSAAICVDTEPMETEDESESENSSSLNELSSNYTSSVESDENVPSRHKTLDIKPKMKIAINVPKIGNIKRTPCSVVGMEACEGTNISDTDTEVLDDSLECPGSIELIDIDPLQLTEVSDEFIENIKSIFKNDPTLMTVFPEEVRKMFPAPSEMPSKYEEEEEEPIKLKPVKEAKQKRRVSNYEPSPKSQAILNTAEFISKKHYYVQLDDDELKIDTLAHLNMEEEQAIIFCNSFEKAEWLSTKLRQKQMWPQVLHEHLLKKERDTLLRTFQQGHCCRVLIATDFITELPIDGVPLIINYDFPQPANKYIWRARFACRDREKPSNSKDIMVVSFVSEANILDIRSLEKSFGLNISNLLGDEIPEVSPELRCEYNTTSHLELERPD